MDSSSSFQILLSLVGADAVSGAFGDLNAKTGQVVGSLTELAGIALSLNGAFAGIKDAFGLGTEFEELSARTGQSVQDLAVLSRAFQMVGLSGDQIGLMANRLQRSMSGMSETGQSTTKAFADLGVTTKQLAGLSFNEQLETLAAGFQKIQSPAERASVAMQIFGRAGGQMLQLLTREGLLSEASDEAASLAGHLQNDAESFEDITNKLSLLKTRFQEMFVVVAEQLLPALRMVGGVISSLNLAPLGAALGTGGVVAFAGIMATTLTSKLNTAVMAFAQGSGAGAVFATEFILPLTAALTGLFTVLLPAIIIGAIGGAILAGVAEGLLDAQNAEDRTRESGAKTVRTDRQKLGAARNQGDVTAARAQMQADLAAAQKVIADLEAKQAENDKGNQAQAQAGVEGAMPLTLSDEEQTQLETAKKTVEDLQTTLSKPVNTDSIFAKNKLEDTKKALDDMAGKLDEMKAKADAIHLENMAPAARLPVLQARRDTQVAIQQAPTPGLNDQQAEIQKTAAELAINELDKQIDATKKEILATQKQQTAEMKKQTDAAEQLQILNLEAQEETAKASGDAAGAERIKEQIDLIRYKKELTDLGARDLSSAQQRVDAEHKLFEVEQQRHAEEKAAEAQKNQMEDAIGRVQNAESAAIGSGLFTDAQQWEIRRNDLTAEIKLRQEYVNLLQKQYDAAKAAGDAVTAGDKDKLKTEAGKGLTGAKNKMNQLGPDPNSFTQQWTAALARLQQNWQITWKTIGQSFTQIVTGFTNSISQNITGLIMQTETWRQALSNVAETLLTSVVGSIVQMATSWMANQLMMAIFGRTLQSGQAAAMVPIAEGISLVWAPAATMVTIATMGAAADAAPIEIMGAVLGTEGIASASSGGYFSGDPGKVRGVFHGGEYIFSAPAVKRYGVDYLDGLHKSGLSGSSVASSGSHSRGRNTSDAGGNRPSRPERTIIYADHAQMRDRLMKDPAFTNHIVDVGYRRRGQIGGL